MKNLISSFVLALLFLSPAVSIAGEKPLIITIRIDKTTTQEDLDRHVEFMKANGYELTIGYVRFNDDGGVEAICGAVDLNRCSGSFETWNMGNGHITVKKNLFGQIAIEVNGKM